MLDMLYDRSFPDSTQANWRAQARLPMYRGCAFWRPGDAAQPRLTFGDCNRGVLRRGAVDADVPMYCGFTLAL